MTVQYKKYIPQRLLLMITKPEDSSTISHAFDELHIPIFCQFRGQGTASTELLDICGLSGTARLITLAMLPQAGMQKFWPAIEEQVHLSQRGGGIAATIPINGIQNQIFQLINDQMRHEIQESMEGDEMMMNEQAGYSMVYVSVNAGFSDDVIDAAQKAGAKGGTVIRGRRRTTENVAQFLNLPIQEEQDFVWIIVPKEIKNDVMSRIAASCGLNTKAHGMIASMPVDEVAGLEKA